MCIPSSPPLRGHSRPAILGRKAIERRFEKTDSRVEGYDRQGLPGEEKRIDGVEALVAGPSGRG